MAVTIYENHQPSPKFPNYTIKINDTHTISTTVTSHPGYARDWLHRTLHQNRNHRHRLIIGLGVQWTPPTISFGLPRPASTIQLCIGRRCLIFQLHHSHSSPRILRRILLDPRNTFVGLWCHSDAKSGMPIDARAHVVDSNGRFLRSSSIAEIADEVLGINIDWDSEIGMSDWEVDELSLDQVRQASVDAFVSFQIGMRIRAWNFNTYL